MKGEWYETYIVGRSRTGGVVFECSKFSPGFLYGKCTSEDRFRPIHSERDVFIEKASKAFHEAADGEINDHAFGAIYDAIQSGELKVPKG